MLQRLSRQTLELVDEIWTDGTAQSYSIEYGSDFDDELFRLHRVYYRYVVWDITHVRRAVELYE